MNERPGHAVGFLHTKLDHFTSENNLSLSFKNATAFCQKNQASGGGGLFTKLAIFKSFSSEQILKFNLSLLLNNLNFVPKRLKFSRTLTINAKF